MLLSTAQFHTVQCYFVQYLIVQYSIVPCNTVQYSRMYYSKVARPGFLQWAAFSSVSPLQQYSAVQYSTVQYCTVQYSTLFAVQYSAVPSAPAASQPPVHPGLHLVPHRLPITGKYEQNKRQILWKYSPITRETTQESLANDQAKSSGKHKDNSAGNLQES